MLRLLSFLEHDKRNHREINYCNRNPIKETERNVMEPLLDPIALSVGHLIRISFSKKVTYLGSKQVSKQIAFNKKKLRLRSRFISNMTLVGGKCKKKILLQLFSRSFLWCFRNRCLERTNPEDFFDNKKFILGYRNEKKNEGKTSLLLSKNHLVAFLIIFRIKNEPISVTKLLRSQVNNYINGFVKFTN